MEKEDMPGNEDKIEKPDGEDKTDVPMLIQRRSDFTGKRRLNNAGTNRNS